MLVRNPYNGALHEAPDEHLYELPETVYDGLGNPVGGIFDDIGKAVGSFAKNILPAASAVFNPAGALTSVAGGLLNKLLPGSPAPASRPPVAAMVGPMPAALPIAAPPAPGALMPMPGMPDPRFAPPWPSGWVNPPLPYTGLGPRRLYMRCAVWPGPAGLVPQDALTMQPALAPAPAPQVIAPVVAPSFGVGHRRFHHRRSMR